MIQDQGLILLLEDESQMRRFLRGTLQSHGYRLIESPSGHDGLMKATTRIPDLVLIDLGLSDMEGIDTTKRFRERCEVPIIVISDREQEEEKIKALDAGADDYLTIPFGAGELLARIRVALRHRVMLQSGQLKFTLGDIKVDLLEKRVFLKDKKIHLTPIEYRLLTVLIKNAGTVVTHTHLLKKVWEIPYTGRTASLLRVYLLQLRRKLEKDPAHPTFLINEPGIGYRLKVGLG